MPEFNRNDLREVIKRGYRIVYFVTEERIEILTIRDGHRRLPLDLADP